MVDASFVVEACLAESALVRLTERDAIAPPLLWSEALSALHELAWRRQISAQLAAIARDALARAPIRRRAPARLQRDAWEIATRLGWAKTYDAEYVALARWGRCPLLTIDGKLAHAAAREVEVLTPSAL